MTSRSVERGIGHLVAGAVEECVLSEMYIAMVSELMYVPRRNFVNHIPDRLFLVSCQMGTRFRGTQFRVEDQMLGHLGARQSPHKLVLFCIGRTQALAERVKDWRRQGVIGNAWKLSRRKEAKWKPRRSYYGACVPSPGLEMTYPCRRIWVP